MVVLEREQLVSYWLEFAILAAAVFAAFITFFLRALRTLR